MVVAIVWCPAISTFELWQHEFSGELIFWRADTGAEVKRLKARGTNLHPIVPPLDRSDVETCWPKAHDAGISKFDFNDDRELVATVSHVKSSVAFWDLFR